MDEKTIETTVTLQWDFVADCWRDKETGVEVTGVQRWIAAPPGYRGGRVDAPYLDDALLQLSTWAERGWIVILRSAEGGRVVLIETPRAFEMDVPNPRSGAMGLRFNTAPHETPAAAMAAAAQVLR